MPAPTQAPGAGSALASVAAAAGVLVSMGAGAAVCLLSGTAPGPGSRSSPPSVALVDPEPAKPRASSHEFALAQDGGFPPFVDANRDGTLDALVQTGYPKKLLAFDGASGRPLWSTSLEGAGFSTHLAVAESRVVVANDVSVELLDASTGKRAASATLNDKARRLCAPSGGKLRVHLFDDSVDAIDPSTGAVASEANRVALHGSLLGAVYPSTKGDERLALFDSNTGKRTHDLELPVPILAMRSRGDGKLVLVGKDRVLLVDASGKLATLVGP